MAFNKGSWGMERPIPGSGPEDDGNRLTNCSAGHCDGRLDVASHG